jgi:uncharacterized protein
MTMDSKNGSGPTEGNSGQAGEGFVSTSVEFPSCGEILRGNLLKPLSGSAPFPAIVMAPGMSGVKEGSIMQFATFFANSGFAVLAFDNINFGESGGSPRQEADPVLQRRGYRDAITFMTLRPEIDEDKIGIFGTSYSGGHTLEVAAHDRRVKCVVAQIPAISGQEAFRRAVRGDLRGAVLKMQDDDRKKRFLGEPAAVIKAVSDNPADLCVMPGRAAYEYFMEQGRVAPNWRNEVTLRSLDFYRGLDTTPYLPFISPTPLLMFVALDDELTAPDIALKAFATALEPKKLVLLPGGHFAPYGAEFELTSTSARDWFAKHLIIGGSAALN